MMSGGGPVCKLLQHQCMNCIVLNNKLASLPPCEGQCYQPASKPRKVFDAQLCQVIKKKLVGFNWLQQVQLQLAAILFICTVLVSCGLQAIMPGQFWSCNTTKSPHATIMTSWCKCKEAKQEYKFQVSAGNLGYQCSVVNKCAQSIDAACTT